MIKNVKNLTKLFMKSETLKIKDRKSLYFWIVVIITFFIAYYSSGLINILININKCQLFINGLFLIMSAIMTLQIVLLGINFYFFSKETEQLLPFPLKPHELLISKFNVILNNLFFTEVIFAVLPLIIYGRLNNLQLSYFINLFIVLLVFPIFINLVISIIMMFFIKLSKYIKNKELFQIVITLIFLLIIFILGLFMLKKIDVIEQKENSTIEIIEYIDQIDKKIQKINKYTINNDLCTNILIIVDNNKLIYIIKLLSIDLILLLLFILLGKKYYLKNILYNNSYSKNTKKIKNKDNKRTIRKAYLDKEIKNIIRTPIFTVQCILPIILVYIIGIMILIAYGPKLSDFTINQIVNSDIKFDFNLSVICLILSLIQIINTISNISITAIDRDGNNNVYLKSLPINLYKQFLYKAEPQIILHLLLNLIIVITLKLVFINFAFVHLIELFIISSLLSIINSFLQVFVDLLKPNINWIEEYKAVKNENKIIQYGITIINILLLIYFNKIFSKINLNYACFFITILLTIILLLINKIIKNNIKKIYKRIN